MGRPRIKQPRKFERVPPEDYAALFTPDQVRTLRARRNRIAAADALTRWEQSRPPVWNADAFNKWINTPPPQWLDVDALRRWEQRRAELLAEWERNRPAVCREWEENRPEWTPEQLEQARAEYNGTNKTR